MTTLKQIPLPTKHQYFADTDGHIWRWTGTELKPLKGWEELNQDHRGRMYHRITLIMQDGPRKYYVHRLMLITFHGHQEHDIARHLNDDPLDNKLSNLSWGTHYENNVTDRLLNGTYMARGKGRTVEAITQETAQEAVPF